MSATPSEILPMEGIAPPDATPAQLMRRHQRLVVVLRFVVLVAIIGGWEGSVWLGWLGPFFFGQPSGIAGRMFTWFTEGTAIGSIWEQIWVTMYEAILGFLIGAALGVVF